MWAWKATIRFRLSLAYALAVYIAGTAVIGGIYLWQLNQLDEPVLMAERRLVVETDGEGPGRLGSVSVIPRDELTETYLAAFEIDARRAMLNQWRRGSIIGLGVLAVVAFGAGWMLSGVALRPVGRMVSVAGEIGAGDLSRRIDLVGSDDELKKLADTFDAMMDRLQESVETRRRFVQDMSHELRNPLAVAQANLELALGEPNLDVDELRQAAEIAHRSTERMGRIVEDLVDQAHSEMPRRMAAVVDIAEVVLSVGQEMERLAHQRSISIKVDESELAPTIQVRADRLALGRAVTNLVSNAVRLAPEGSEVEIRVVADGNCVKISVADSGPGIKESDRERIFDRFWRGPGSASGLGLGLSIVRQVVDAHGGWVSVDSQYGQGSTFTINLPILKHDLSGDGWK